VATRINLVHKLYDRKGGVSGYMVKDGRGAPDDRLFYDASSPS
jgi:hypothetical protein